jgi:hypothetical protein
MFNIMMGMAIYEPV